METGKVTEGKKVFDEEGGERQIEMGRRGVRERGKMVGRTRGSEKNISWRKSRS